VDPDEKSAWEVRLVETSKTPSKDGCSSSPAGPFDVLPVMSRIGEDEGCEESEFWTKVRFSSALVVAARMVYRGASMFDNGVALTNELVSGSFKS